MTCAKNHLHKRDNHDSKRAKDLSKVPKRRQTGKKYCL
ncbi:hypothetical protein MY1_0845 [Nitrosarchaeum koreense MY1]|uniref:Uncharacterized protein n=1 Tax=Nitrosarchaeum koreense MY1 TaxID=1001994 RepID=F9CWF5_9ARCH|nr:hypothetical protein MY1_0845 [Nitrosarchaeum koreense MY1]